MSKRTGGAVAITLSLTALTVGATVIDEALLSAAGTPQSDAAAPAAVAGEPAAPVDVPVTAPSAPTPVIVRLLDPVTGAPLPADAQTEARTPATGTTAPEPITATPASAVPTTAAPTTAAPTTEATTAAPTTAPATTAAPSTTPASAAPQTLTSSSGQKWSLTFSDEFTNGIGTAWSVVSTGGGIFDDTFGEECYDPSQVEAVTGELHLTASRRPIACKGKQLSYASGLVTTRERFAQAYGRFEARMKLPQAKGSWPAFWLMPVESAYGPWPSSGEIDIMEYVSDSASTVYNAAHWLGDGKHQQDTSPAKVTGTANDWHTYAIEWVPGEIRWYVDGELTKSFAPETGGAPFDRPFYLILNQSVGGAWPGTPAPGSFPNTVAVDWVRVYRAS